MVISNPYTGQVFIPEDFVPFLKTGPVKNIYKIPSGGIAFSTANYHREFMGNFEIKNNKIRVPAGILKEAGMILQKGDIINFLLVQLPLIEDFEVRIYV